MTSEENKTKKTSPSCMLSLLYGKDYDKNLGKGCISFANENSGKNQRFILRLIALLMVGINISMALYLFPWENMFYMFTNWGVMITFLCNGLIMYYATLERVTLGQYVFAHLIFEFAFALNMTTFIVYWGVIHS